MKAIFTLYAVLIATLNIQGQTKFQNDKFGFRGQVPADWHIYAEIKENEAGQNAIIDWGLPKVYSNLEKTTIENAVSITAYKRADIKSIHDLMKFEFERIGNVLLSKEITDSIPYYSYTLITLQNGLKYKSQVKFTFNNNVGYVLNYTATPGTYDMNIQKFNSFVKNIQFFKPVEQEKKTSQKSNIHCDGLYVVKTAEIEIPNNKMEIFTYIRFYEDGTVYTQAVNSYDPEKVIKWLGKNGRFERKGEYKIEGADITFTVTNNESADKEIEGARSDKFSGKITDPNKLFLEVKYSSGEVKNFWFEFVKVN